AVNDLAGTTVEEAPDLGLVLHHPEQEGDAMRAVSKRLDLLRADPPRMIDGPVWRCWVRRIHDGQGCRALDPAVVAIPIGIDRSDTQCLDGLTDGRLPRAGEAGHPDEPPSRRQRSSVTRAGALASGGCRALDTNDGRHLRS